MIVKSVPNVRNKINYNYKRNYTECHTVKPLKAGGWSVHLRWRSIDIFVKL